MFKKFKRQEESIDKKTLSLDQQIEAVLFFKAEEVSLNFLSKLLNQKKSLIKEAVLKLRERLEETSLILIENNDKYLLTTSGEFSELIERMKEKESFGELSQSALETLSIILYKGEIDRFHLDEIRGVNSSYTLRNLIIRGLIEKKIDLKITKYTPTLDMLSFLGIDVIDKLPSFESVRKKIEEIEGQNNG